VSEEVRIVFPVGAFGASQEEGALDTMLRKIANAASPDPDGEWSEKYGTDFENDVFMMHRFCWCERQECPWCMGCECPEGSWRYFVDDMEVPFDEFVGIHKRLTAGLSYGTPAYEKASAEANNRRSERHDPVCDFCINHSGKTPPNFWYKPTDLKVWWYKYIGRSVEVNRSVMVEELMGIEVACLRSLKKGAEEVTE
jgi:hypothetical protein